MKCSCCNWKWEGCCIHPNVMKDKHPFPNCEGELWKNPFGAVILTKAALKGRRISGKTPEIKSFDKPQDKSCENCEFGDKFTCEEQDNVHAYGNCKSWQPKKPEPVKEVEVMKKERDNLQKRHISFPTMC